MKISLLYITVTLYFFSGIVMMAVGDFVLDDLPLAIAGLVNATVAFTILIIIKFNEYKQSKSK